MTEKKPGRPPSANPVPAAERIRQFRNRQEQGGKVRTEVSISKDMRDSVRSISGQMGMPYAQAVGSLLEVGFAVYQANAASLQGSSDALQNLSALLSSQAAALPAGSLEAQDPKSVPESDSGSIPAKPQDGAQESSTNPCAERKDPS